MRERQTGESNQNQSEGLTRLIRYRKDILVATGIVATALLASYAGANAALGIKEGAIVVGSASGVVGVVTVVGNRLFK